MEAVKAIELLLGKGPTNLQRNLEDWTTQEFEGKNILFYQGKNYIPRDYELRREITSQFHDRISVGHPGKLRPLTRSRNIIGGRECGVLSKTTLRVVESVSNSR